MEKDLMILDGILKDLNYSTEGREILVNKILRDLENYRLDKITRNFIYVSLIPEEGKRKSSEIADYWEEAKNLGSYKSKLQRKLEDSPIFSKYLK